MPEEDVRDPGVIRGDALIYGPGIIGNLIPAASLREPALLILSLRETMPSVVLGIDSEAETIEILGEFPV